MVLELAHSREQNLDGFESCNYGFEPYLHRPNFISCMERKDPFKTKMTPKFFTVQNHVDGLPIMPASQRLGHRAKGTQRDQVYSIQSFSYIGTTSRHIIQPGTTEVKEGQKEKLLLILILTTYSLNQLGGTGLLREDTRGCPVALSLSFSSLFPPFLLFLLFSFPSLFFKKKSLHKHPKKALALATPLDKQLLRLLLIKLWLDSCSSDFLWGSMLLVAVCHPQSASRRSAKPARREANLIYFTYLATIWTLLQVTNLWKNLLDSTLHAPHPYAPIP